MKTRKNFRLSAEALSHLERLSGLWGCDATQVIERALSEMAASEGIVPEIVSGDEVAFAVPPLEEVGDHVVDVRAGQIIAPSGKRTKIERVTVEPPHPGPGVVDPEIHAMVVEADKAIPKFPPSKPLSRAEREAKIDAFQRGMVKKGKK